MEQDKGDVEDMQSPDSTELPDPNTYPEETIKIGDDLYIKMRKSDGTFMWVPTVETD